MYGAALGPWLRMLLDAGELAPGRRRVAAAVTLCALLSRLPAALESLRFAPRLRASRLVAPPIFVLGHWRSGTTLLHGLLGLDTEQLAFPTLWDVFNPALNLSLASPLWADSLLPRTRVQDAVPSGFGTPQEEEFAILLLTGLSLYGRYVFPKRADRYERYCDFADAAAGERESWRGAYVAWVRKLSLKYGRRLVLKSPANTARIPLLLDLFPEAKFVYLRRDPYEVLASSLHNEETMLTHFALQPWDRASTPERVLALGARVFDAYRRHRGAIPATHAIELEYEELVADPEATLRRIYAFLGLDFDARLRRALRTQETAHRSYVTTAHDPLPPHLRGDLRDRWASAFEG